MVGGIDEKMAIGRVARAFFLPWRRRAIATVHTKRGCSEVFVPRPRAPTRSLAQLMMTMSHETVVEHGRQCA